jgi:dynamin 1-like protein
LEGKTIKDCLRDEERFFKTNENYRALSSRCGVPYLCRSLNEIIVKNIKQCLPLIRSKITSLLYQKEKELKAIRIQKGAADQQQLILNIIAKYAKQFDEFIEGKFVKDTASELKGGSRLNYIFYEVFTKAIKKIDPFDSLSDDDIKTAIRNASGLGPNLLVPEVAFEILSKK